MPVCPSIWKKGGLSVDSGCCDRLKRGGREFLLLQSTMLCKCTMDESSELKGGGENYSSSQPTPIQIRVPGVGNVILEHHGAMWPRERVSFAGNLEL